MIKIIREKDGRVIELSEHAYNELMKGDTKEFRLFTIEAPKIIKQTTLNDKEISDYIQPKEVNVTDIEEETKPKNKTKKPKK